MQRRVAGRFRLTEPGAGTDAQGQQTIAKEDGDYWVLNGSKIFITNAGFADVFIVIAVTDNVLDKRGRPTKLCSAFIVERTDRASPSARLRTRWAFAVLLPAS